MWLKLCAREIGPPSAGISLEDGVALARMAEAAGFDAITPASASALPDTALPCAGASTPQPRDAVMQVVDQM